MKRPVVSVLLLLTHYPWVALASGGANIRLSAERSTVAVGQEVVVEVLVEKAPFTYGVDVQIAFDPRLLEVVDSDAERAGLQVSPGGFIDPKRSFALQHNVDNDAGRVDYALTLMNPAPAVKGDGRLARIVFRGKARGKSEVTVRQGQLGTRDGEVLNPSLGGLVLTLLGPGEKPQAAVVTAARDLTREVVSIVADPDDPKNRWWLFVFAVVVVVAALLVGFRMGRGRERA